MFPIWKTYIAARVEDKENGLKHANPQVEALTITVFLTFVGFFIFVFIPTTMLTIWNWVPYVTK